MDRASLWVRIAAAVVLVSGVACQFLQKTDPTFPLLYFTVDSALLLAAALVGAELRPQSLVTEEIRGATTVGVVLSGLIFTAVIAPATETGTWFQPHDDPWVRAAILLMHGIGPVLAVTDFMLHPLRAAGRSWRVALRWCVWPLVYLVVVLPLDLAGIAEIPYPFLRIRGLPTLGAFAALLLIAGTLSVGLVGLHRRVRGVRAATPSLRASS